MGACLSNFLSASPCAPFDRPTAHPSESSSSVSMRLLCMHDGLVLTARRSLRPWPLPVNHVSSGAATGTMRCASSRESAFPPSVGRLEPADALNGPSGRALDQCILQPLGVCRNDAWLCDLVPYSCANKNQARAIADRYAPLAGLHGLPEASIPSLPAELANDARKTAILEELRESQAKTLILLGDKPVQWFLKNFDARWGRLSDFEGYGGLHSVQIDGMRLKVLPLVHPRQAGRLGSFSPKWYAAHAQWVPGAGSILA